MLLELVNIFCAWIPGEGVEWFCHHGSALRKPEKINAVIKEDTSNFDQLTLKADQDMLWTECWTKISVINVGAKLIVSNVDPQYLKELEEDFTVYPSSTICDLITHLRKTWCKIQNQENLDAKAALYTPWSDTPNRHITKYALKTTCSALACAAIGVPCTVKEKVMIFVENMYTSAHFTETELVAW